MSTIKLSSETAIELIHKMVFEAMGCTEPVAAALAVAVAYHEIGGDVKSVTVTLDKNVYKNAMAVGIPGTNGKGPKMAIALGLACGDPKKGLLLLESVCEDAIKKAQQFLGQDIIKLKLNEKATHIHIQADLKTSNGTATAIIDGCHDHLILVKKNNKIIYHDIAHKDQKSASDILSPYDFSDITMRALMEIVERLDEKELQFLLKGFDINLAASKKGQSEKAGMMLGQSLQKLIDQGLMGDAIIDQAQVITAAATDARMGGLKVPIFGCGGSGNHGITFFLTAGLICRHFKLEAKLSRAYAFGLLLLAVIKKTTGLLTPICGCGVAAGASACAAIVYAKNGDDQQILNALNLVMANIAGMVCDGAKYGCALKIATSVRVAIESAFLALNGTKVPVSDGIVGATLQETMQNLALLHEKGMCTVDKTVLDILEHKCECGEI